MSLSNAFSTPLFGPFSRGHCRRAILQRTSHQLASRVIISGTTEPNSLNRQQPAKGTRRHHHHSHYLIAAATSGIVAVIVRQETKYRRQRRIVSACQCNWLRRCCVAARHKFANKVTIRRRISSRSIVHHRTTKPLGGRQSKRG